MKEKYIEEITAILNQLPLDKLKTALIFLKHFA